MITENPKAMATRVALSLAAVGAAGLTALGCGPSYRNAFSHHFLDNQEADMAAALERLPAPANDDHPENTLGQPLVAIATYTEDGTGRQVAVYRVDSGEQLWSTAIDAATQPEILGDVLVVSTREQLFGYDLSSGRELWHRDLPDLAYVGATRDGDTIYWAATVGALGGARRVGHVVAIDARGGGERWRHEVEGVFGQPAAKGGLVFVPWERQNIAILDGVTGDEVARLRSTDDVIAWAFDHPTGIYYGGRGVYRLTPRSASGTREGSTHLRPDLGELPRQPESIFPDGYVPRPGGRSARGRIRVYFNPAPTDDATAIHVEGDTYYFVYFRYVFAYDLDGTLRWTRIVEQDIANAEAMPHGLLTVGEQGQVTLLDRDTGNTRWEQALDVQVASVAIDAAGFAPGGTSGDERALRQSLNELVLDPDNRLVAARAYAINLLSAIPEEEITRDLLDLYQQRSMPGALKEAIREALRTRNSGAQYLMAALERRYDFLEDTEAPPLEAIVPALLEMEHREAVPLLINHMMDHETPAEALPLVVQAVVTLGQADALDALRRFVVLYRADSLTAGPLGESAAASQDVTVDSGPASEDVVRARECAQRGDNACVIRTLRDHATTPDAMALLIDAYRASGRAQQASPLMHTYVERWGNTAQGRAYQQILAGDAPAEPAHEQEESATPEARALAIATRGIFELGG
ncbi:MAG: PQQ-binding-like beta-propeller repeat protein, partial [Sandaracinaceae bacterium]